MPCWRTLTQLGRLFLISWENLIFSSITSLLSSEYAKLPIDQKRTLRDKISSSSNGFSFSWCPAPHQCSMEMNTGTLLTELFYQLIHPIRQPWRRIFCSIGHWAGCRQYPIYCIAMSRRSRTTLNNQPEMCRIGNARYPLHSVNIQNCSTSSQHLLFINHL